VFVGKEGGKEGGREGGREGEVGVDCFSAAGDCAHAPGVSVFVGKEGGREGGGGSDG